MKTHATLVGLAVLLILLAACHSAVAGDRIDINGGSLKELEIKLDLEDLDRSTPEATLKSLWDIKAEFASVELLAKLLSVSTWEMERLWNGIVADEFLDQISEGVMKDPEAAVKEEMPHIIYEVIDVDKNETDATISTTKRNKSRQQVQQIVYKLKKHGESWVIAEENRTCPECLGKGKVHDKERGGIKLCVECEGEGTVPDEFGFDFGLIAPVQDELMPDLSSPKGVVEAYRTTADRVFYLNVKLYRQLIPAVQTMLSTFYTRDIIQEFNASLAADPDRDERKGPPTTRLVSIDDLKDGHAAAQVEIHISGDKWVSRLLDLERVHTAKDDNDIDRWEITRISYLCFECNGGKACRICRGTGIYQGADCGLCKGNMKCIRCEGSGWLEPSRIRDF